VRQTYHIRLDALGEHGARMCSLAGRALEDATEALLHANLYLAEQVISSDAELDEMRADAEGVALELLTLQSPVASDLRVLVSALWIVSDLKRMGELAIHVAKVARRRYPVVAVPIPIRPVIRQMGVVGAQLAEAAEQVLRWRDVDLARSLVRQDDAMDELQDKVLGAVHSSSWVAGVEPAVDAAMLSRFYERFGDHAVAVSRRVIFLVTGENLGGDTNPADTSAQS
jgi:phosphate transport system protein